MSLCEQLTTQTRHDLDFSQERLKNCSDVLNNYFRCMLTSVPYLWGGTRAGGGERFASSTNNKASGCVFVVCVCSGEQTHFRPIIQSVLCLSEFHVFTDVKFSNRWILQPNSDQQGKIWKCSYPFCVERTGSEGDVCVVKLNKKWHLVLFPFLETISVDRIWIWAESQTWVNHLHKHIKL